MAASGKLHRSAGRLSTGGYGPIRTMRRRWPQEGLAALLHDRFEPYFDKCCALHECPLSRGLPKTSNNHLGFERDFWQRQSGWFWRVPKRRVLGAASMSALRTARTSTGSSRKCGYVLFLGDTPQNSIFTRLFGSSL
jgi:hypothetical protein